MRDIVTASYNHTPKSGTLNNTDYKAYKDFMEHYTDAKNCKDEVESVSSNDSGISSSKLFESKSNNTSTSSLNSEVNGGTAVFSKVEEPSPSAFIGGNRTGSFRNYLDNYNNKKFGSVKPVLPSKPNATTKKSELVIQVGESLDLVKKGVTSPKITTLQRPLVSPHLNKPPSAPPPPPHSQELSQQAVSYTQQTNNTPLSSSPPPPPPPLPQTQQIFSPPPPPPISGLLGCSNTNQTKKWTTVETENCQPKNDQPKIPKDNMAAANLAKILNEHVLARRKISDTVSPCATSTSEMCVKPTDNQKASTLPRQLKTATAEVPLTKFKNSLQNRTERSQISPKAPSSLPKVQRSVSPKASTRAESVDYYTTTVVPVIDRSTTPEVSPSNFLQKRPETSQISPKVPPSLPRVQRSTSPKATTCVDSVDYCTTTVVPVTDGSATVNKGDPNVKKLVYNTYRGLLGAYNNKANDMISTLPRNMVTEDKGVGKLVETITLQCRLDKLNGRINPKLEQE